MRTALLILFLPMAAFGQFITNVIQWQGNVGIPGGIPHRTAIFCNVLVSIPGTNITAKGDDSTDDTSAIQTALNLCTSNQVVYVPTATYKINGNLVVPTGVTMRGDGPGKTIFDAKSSAGLGSAVIAIGGTSPNLDITKATTVSADIAAGSSNITVTSAANMAVGKSMLINITNSLTMFVNNVGDQGACTWCDDWGGGRDMGQIVEITGVSGTSITFWPPAYLTYSNSLSILATPFTRKAVWSGVEDMTVFCNNTGAGTSFMSWMTAYCWFKNVEGNFTDGDHCELHYCYRNEVRHCYFHDAYEHGPGQYDATLLVAESTAASLLEDNILWRLHGSIIIERGSSGNVAAYNFSTNMYASGNKNTCPQDLTSCHGAHTMYNLWEGNYCVNFNGDSIWGSSTYNTFFRNYASGENWNSQPEDARYGGSTNTPLPAPLNKLTFPQVEYEIAIAIWPADLAPLYNIVGNVVGDAYYLGNTNGTPHYIATPPTVLSLYNGSSYEYAIGYTETGSATTWTTNYTNMLFQTFIEGNWDIINNAQLWTNMSPTAINSSYYLTTKPSYFGTCPWPPVNPANPTAANPTNIPAGLRFFTGSDPPVTQLTFNSLTVTHLKN